MYFSLPLATAVLGLFAQFSSAYPGAAHSSLKATSGVKTSQKSGILQETIKIPINTPIPSGTDPAAVLAIVQNPVTMITLNPLVKTYSLVPGSNPVTYSVTDKLLTIFKTTYTASFTNTTNGMDTTSKAAGGLTLGGHWSVSNGMLMEEVDVSGSDLVIPFVKSEILKSHQQLHTDLLKKAASMGSGTSSKRASLFSKHKLGKRRVVKVREYTPYDW